MKKLWMKFISKQYRKYYPDRLEVIKERTKDKKFLSRSKMFDYLEKQPELRRFFEYIEEKRKIIKGKKED